MRVHPAPRKRNIITFRYDINPALSSVAGGGAAALGRQKKLRRLPHIFSKILELPFDSDADVSVQEDPDEFRFAIAADDDEFDGEVRAHAIEIHPGVMKVVVRDGVGGDGDLDLLEELELDRWRFRLPPCTRPALASATYLNGELVVTIPKGVGPEEDGEVEVEVLGGDGNRGFGGSGGIGRLVVVQ